MERVVITEGDAEVSEIIIGEGVLARASQHIAVNESRRRIAVLAQPTIVPFVDELVRSLATTGAEVAVVPLPDGESAKNLATVEGVALELNRLGMSRGDTVVGIGGGAATDVAGFIAATYLRGIECVVVPTTLLGAVDASIGGKTGVNVGGKNLLGVFQHPSVVLVDVDVIRGIPENLLVEGTAEGIKAGLVGDPGLVELYRAYGIEAPLDEVIKRAVGVKARIVSQDFRESGVRAFLNYGHTVGHAVEVAGHTSHGEAVAIGMVAAGLVGERLVGFADRAEQEELIAELGLPTRSPRVDPAEISRLMALDKKRDAGGTRFVVLEEIGAPRVVHPDDATVRASLRAIGID